MADMKYTTLDKTILAALVGQERYQEHQDALAVARKSGEDLILLVKRNPLFPHYLASICQGSHIEVEVGTDGEIMLLWDGKKAKKPVPPPLPGKKVANSKGSTMKDLRARAAALGVDISDLGQKRGAIAARLAEMEGWDRVGEEAVATVASMEATPGSKTGVKTPPNKVAPPQEAPTKEVAPKEANPQDTPKGKMAWDSLDDVFEDASRTLDSTPEVAPKVSDDEVLLESYTPIRRNPRVRLGSPVPVKVVDFAAHLESASKMDLEKVFSEESDD